MLLLPILLPLVGGIVLLFLPDSWTKPLTNGCVGLATAFAWALPFLSPLPLSLGNFPFSVVFSLEIDGISIFFSYLFTLTWWVVLQYAHTFLAHDPEKKRFFAFYTATLGALVGLCYADNLITLYLFFEFVGMLCLPLIAHDRSEEALRTARKYLYYAVAGAFMGLTAIFYFFTLEIPQTFQEGGIPELLQQGELSYVLNFTLLAVIGFGCKSGLFPLQAWLKTTDSIAPSPAAALLSAITTKAGILAILRLLYYVVGPEVIQGTFVQTWGLSLSILTIFMGSLLAFREKVLKKRLAYSTVSQLSYVIFALFLFHPLGFVGALLQVLFHALAKTTLFLSTGCLIRETGRTHVSQLHGLGKDHKRSIWLFTIASLSLIGLPLTGGFVSKWYIAQAAASLGGLAMTGVATLLVSALLTAAYLLPIPLNAFLSSAVPQQSDREETSENRETSAPLPEEVSPEFAPDGLPLQCPGLPCLLLLALGIFPLPVFLFAYNIACLLGLGGGL